MPDLVLKPSGGANIVLRPQSRPRWYAAQTAPAALVEVGWHYEDEPPNFVRIIGKYPPGARFSVPYNPDVDKNVVVRTRSYSADGTPDVVDWADATAATVLVQRDTAAPTIGQVSEATAELITVGVTGHTRFARKRKVRIADNAEMTDASVTEFASDSYVSKELPRYVEIARSAMLVAAFMWTGDDPATNGFTKTGTGTTSANSSPAGWRINTLASDGSTYYSKSSFPAGAFEDGFTLEVTPPAIDASDGGALPNASVSVTVDDGTYQFRLTFDATSVYLNGGAAHAHGGGNVRLVVAVGGSSADLWAAAVKVENDTTAEDSDGDGAQLRFGDLASTDDANVVWKSLAYALTPQDPTLAQTIFVGVSHSSGGAYGAESAITQFTFASEAGTGGTSGSFDPTPRDTLDLPGL